jgi:hypothetical protein
VNLLIAATNYNPDCTGYCTITPHTTWVLWLKLAIVIVAVAFIFIKCIGGVIRAGSRSWYSGKSDAEWKNSRADKEEEWHKR